MKKFKQLKHCVCALLMLLVLSCSLTAILPASITAEAAAVKINKQKITLNRSSSCQLKITGTSKKVTWKSNNPSVAKVSSTGLVKAKKVGKTKITARVNGKKYTCTVTVENPVLKPASEGTIMVGQGLQLQLKGTKQRPKWSSSDKRVATVTSNGWVLGKSVGTTIITARVNGDGIDFILKVKKTPEPTPPQTEPAPPQTEPEPSKPQGTTYGSISGNISYLYGDYADEGAYVILVPKNGAATSLDFVSVDEYHYEEQEEVFLYVTEADEEGDYRINHVAAGDYRVLMISDHASPREWFGLLDVSIENAPDEYYEKIYGMFAPQYLKTETARELATEIVFYNKYLIRDITIYGDENITLSYDFGKELD